VEKYAEIQAEVSKYTTKVQYGWFECYVLSGSIEFEATSQTGDYYLPAHAIIGRESTPIRLDTC